MIINCRICLSENADKDICTLPTDIGVETSAEDVILFILGIEISNQSKITTKLCSKCHKIIQKYYKFKLLAQESNLYLQNKNLIKDEENVMHLKNFNFKNEQNIDIQIKQVKDETVEYLYYEKLEPEVLAETWIEDNKIEPTPIIQEQHGPFIPIPEPLKVESKRKVKKKAFAPRKEKSLNKLFLCEPCGKTFSAKSCMQVHQGKFHSDLNANRFQCDACQQSFFRKFDLQRHIDKLHMEWRCHLCNMLLNSRLNYLKHVKSHGMTSEINTTRSRYKVCPVCGKLISHLAIHLARHRGQLYPCKGCAKKYRSLAARERHYKVVHEGIVYHCDICDKDVKDQLQHNKFYHIPDGLKHECTICGQRAISLSALNVHLSTHFVPHLPCPKCPKLFKDEAKLKSHSRQVHERELRHMCPECPKGFFHKSDLTIHMATHTLLRPFKCDHCYEPFKLRRDLVKHLKTKHSRT